MSRLQLSRLRFWGLVVSGGCMFIVNIIFQFLEKSHLLEYIHHQYPNLYALLSLRETMLALSIVGLTLLVTAIKLRPKREKQQTAPELETVRHREFNRAHASIGDININIPNYQSQSTQTSNVAHSKKDQNIPLIPQITSMPRVPVPLTVDVKGQLFIEPITDGHHTFVVPSALVCFRHDSKEPINVSGVMAQVEYKACTQPRSIYPNLILQSACWVKEHEYVDFFPGSINNLIIAVFEGGKYWAFDACGLDGNRQRSMKNENLNETEYDVKIKLISRYKGEVATFLYRLTLKPQLTLEELR